MFSQRLRVIIFVGLLLVLVIVYLNFNEPITDFVDDLAEPSDTFNVSFYSTYSSSGGTRILNITYFVVDSEIVGCSGYYSNADDYVEECDLDIFLSEEGYNVPKAFIYFDDEPSGSFSQGPAMYEWRIIS